MSTLHFIIDVLDVVAIVVFASGYTKQLAIRSKEFCIGWLIFFASSVLSVIDLFS